MKIYNEIVFDVDGNVIYEDSFEYSGDVMLLQVEDHDGDGKITVIDLNIAKAQGASGSLIKEYMTVILGGDWTPPKELVTDLEEYDVNLETQVNENKISQQTQASDLQLNPLPSLPSISNVGAVPFTGVVNWNAIPGGFQPLPQVAGGKKKLYQLSQFHGGINQSSSPRDISDQECQEANNVTFSEIGRIKLVGDCQNENNTLKEFGNTITNHNIEG